MIIIFLHSYSFIVITVNNFCDRRLTADWTCYPHVYLVYSEHFFSVLALDKQRMDSSLRSGFEELERAFKTNSTVHPVIPDSHMLQQRWKLIHYLSIAIGIKETAVNELLEANNYILTLDYTLKVLTVFLYHINFNKSIMQTHFFLQLQQKIFQMIHINERRKCRIPTIIQGEVCSLTQ